MRKCFECTCVIFQNRTDRIDDVMVRVLRYREVDREFQPKSVQNKDYDIGICCFSATHVALMSKIKDW